MLDLALPTLAKLIDEKTHELRLMWQGASNNSIHRDDLYEDLHWLLMIAGKIISPDDISYVINRPLMANNFANFFFLFFFRKGHVLTKDKDEPISLIPATIISYSIQRVPRININDSLNLVAMVNRPITQSDFPSLEESTDHVIWFV